MEQTGRDTNVGDFVNLPVCCATFRNKEVLIQYPFVRASELFVCISKILHGPLMLADRPPRKSVVRLTDRPDMTLDVYRGRKTTIQQYNDRRTFG